MTPPWCIDSGIYFFCAGGIDDSGFSVTSPAQVLAAAITEGHELPIQRYAVSGANIASVVVGKYHYFFNEKLCAVFCGRYAQ